MPGHVPNIPPRVEFVALIMSTQDDPWIGFAERSFAEQEKYVRRARALLKHLQHTNPTRLQLIWDAVKAHAASASTN